MFNILYIHNLTQQEERAGVSEQELAINRDIEVSAEMETDAIEQRNKAEDLSVDTDVLAEHNVVEQVYLNIFSFKMCSEYIFIFLFHSQFISRTKSLSVLNKLR